MSIQRNQISRFSSPPRPRLTFRIGVLGHRPNRLKNIDPSLLENTIQSVLEFIKNEISQFFTMQTNLYDPQTPIMRIISPLAEGADRIVAEQALKLGFDLCCPMPFPRSIFEQDFLPGKAMEVDSLERFNRLLIKAHEETNLTIFELDGNRNNEEKAYAACGGVVLNQSDLLLVIWDGEIHGKAGGTEETLNDARRRGIPIIWIDASTPHRWMQLKQDVPIDQQSLNDVSENCIQVHFSELHNFLQSLLALPQIQENEKTKNKETSPDLALKCFYSEKKPCIKWGFWWNIFKNILGDLKLPSFSFRIKEFENDLSDEWNLDAKDPLGPVIQFLRPFYAWSDKLAVYYSDLYRSAFLISYLLAAGAVAAALFPVALGIRLGDHSSSEMAFIISELVAIILILGSILFGYYRRWHERWLDYRLIAELIRHNQLLVPLGGDRPLPQIPAHLLSFGNPGSTWMVWYVRAIERYLGLPNVRIDKAYLEEFKKNLLKILDDQLIFHSGNYKRNQRLEMLLHNTGIVLLVLTLIICTIHLLPILPLGIHLKLSLSQWAIFLCGFLPALGAAFAGINNQGEFRRLAKRSKAMTEEIDKLITEVNSFSIAQAKVQASINLTHFTLKASQLFVDEVLDWRLVFRDRPLVPPT